VPTIGIENLARKAGRTSVDAIGIVPRNHRIHHFNNTRDEVIIRQTAIGKQSGVADINIARIGTRRADWIKHGQSANA
jgi:hypothetical protein